MMAFPGETYGEGRFDRDKAFTLYNSAGDVDEVGVLPPLERLVSLNGMALGDCLGKSAAIAKGDQWGFTLVKKGGDQCVYVGTPAEAANGNGGTRIEGVVSVAIWVGRVARKPHVAKRKAPPTPTDDTFVALADSVSTCCYTQVPGATRDVFCEKLSDLHHVFNQLAVKERAHPVVRMGLQLKPPSK